MIIKLKNTVSPEDINELAELHKAFHIKNENDNLLITSSSLKKLPSSIEDNTDKFWVFDNNIKTDKIKQKKG